VRAGEKLNTHNSEAHPWADAFDLALVAVNYLEPPSPLDLVFSGIPPIARLSSIEATLQAAAD
jgi:hypothetical protein